MFFVILGQPKHKAPLKHKASFPGHNFHIFIVPRFYPINHNLLGDCPFNSLWTYRNFLIGALNFSNSITQFQDHNKYADLLSSPGPVELSVHSVHEEMTCTKGQHTHNTLLNSL